MSETETPPIAQAPANVRWRVAATMALINVLFVITFLYDDITYTAATGTDETQGGLRLLYAVAMVLGGGIAGYLLAGLFGRSGFLGWVAAFFGGLLATLVGGLVGSLLGDLPRLLGDGWQTTDLVAIVAGTLLPIFAFADLPLLIPVWLGLIFATHVWVKRLRT